MSNYIIEKGTNYDLFFCNHMQILMLSTRGIKPDILF